ncbi:MULTISPECIES: flagellar export chaperone FliS [unclassified Lebetimonas]|uniref:flagellar export chaperone FliS n=1 Tax=unclassified Lebetimonas TaxID=2648158 RepID=UPI0004677CE2|nr:MULTISPECIES: flagellar export chaperone FliS [unclassified Lebetimonas]
MTYNKALESYNQMNVQIDKPEKLVLMLYEGALRFVNFAKKAIKEGDIEKKVKYIIKVSNIFIELINSLDYENGGDIAYYLNGLYGYQLELLAKANLENDEKYLEDVIRVLKGLIEAWKEETGIS